ncbi:MAG: hypothetical protein B7Z08_08505 [Sphingomonadales bacterium 32-68-7]|nr:MAG: hypothetical protein B7Z33_09490 [Sphingomonadales bacterium 12-68-11]OYX08671.1 MAG: hypothetical protein B7Z08_08505 [Sphingomonadales bacterium 32-68-7]
METITIEIDFDIHKLIEAERRSFSEKPLHALRRLLHLPALTVSDQSSDTDGATGQAWVEDGVVIPHGSYARMEYGRGSQRYEGRFLNGFLVVNGTPFRSLSSAASSLAKTKRGANPSLNGWNYWQVQLPGSDRWDLMEHLRKRASGKAIF